MRKLSPGKSPAQVTGWGWTDPAARPGPGTVLVKPQLHHPPWEAGQGSEGREAVEPTNSQAGDTVGHAAQRGPLTLGATASWSVKGVTKCQRQGAGWEGDGSPAHSEETRWAFCSHSHLWLQGQNIRGKLQKPYNLARTLRPNRQPASTPRSLSRRRSPRGLPTCPPFPGPVHQLDTRDRTWGDTREGRTCHRAGAGPRLSGRPAPSSGPQLAS